MSGESEQINPREATAMQFLVRALAAEPERTGAILNRASELYRQREPLERSVAALQAAHAAAREEDPTVDAICTLRNVASALDDDPNQDALTKHAARSIRRSLRLKR